MNKLRRIKTQVQEQHNIDTIAFNLKSPLAIVACDSLEDVVLDDDGNITNNNIGRKFHGLMQKYLKETQDQQDQGEQGPAGPQGPQRTSRTCR